MCLRVRIRGIVGVELSCSWWNWLKENRFPISLSLSLSLSLKSKLNEESIESIPSPLTPYLLRISFVLLFSLTSGRLRNQISSGGLTYTIPLMTSTPPRLTALTSVRYIGAAFVIQILHQQLCHVHDQA